MSGSSVAPEAWGITCEYACPEGGASGVQTVASLRSEAARGTEGSAWSLGVGVGTLHGRLSGASSALSDRGAELGFDSTVRT